MTRALSTQQLLLRMKIRNARDAEWTRLLFGVSERILTPEQGADFLQKDRLERARNVAEARPRRGPRHY